MSDPRVRPAVAHAFSQDAFIRVVRGGFKPAITHLLGPNVRCSDDRYRGYDPKEARRLLEEYGQPVVLSMPYNVSGRKGAALLEQMMLQVGIQLKPEPVDQKGRLKRVRSGRFDIVQWGTRPSPDMGGQLAFYAYSRTKRSFSGYRSSEMDDLFDVMQKAESMPARRRAQCRVSAKINGSAHLVFTGGTRRYAVSGPVVSNVGFGGNGVLDMVGIRIVR